MRRLLSQRQMYGLLNRKIHHSNIPNKKLYCVVLSYLMIESAKIDFQQDLKDVAEQIEDWQENYGKKIDFDAIYKYMPNTFRQGTGYRTILINKDKIDKSNIEQSIRDNIYFGITSWTFNKEYADTLENTLLIDVYDKTKYVPVRLEANIKGLYLPSFWEELKNEWYDNEQQYNDDWYGIEEDHRHEDEIICNMPDNYKIYNLDEIAERL